MTWRRQAISERITDPRGSSWYELKGHENGDKRAWSFGTALGKTSTGAYNQVIGTGNHLPSAGMEQPQLRPRADRNVGGSGIRA
jgi:hypothetical protein